MLASQEEEPRREKVHPIHWEGVGCQGCGIRWSVWTPPGGKEGRVMWAAGAKHVGLQCRGQDVCVKFFILFSSQIWLRVV